MNTIEKNTISLFLESIIGSEINYTDYTDIGEGIPIYSHYSKTVTKEYIPTILDNIENNLYTYYYELPYMCNGDYSGSFVEASNRQVFFELFKDKFNIDPIDVGIHTQTYAYGTETIWIDIRINSEILEFILETIRDLENYPCLNDEAYSQLEYDEFYDQFIDTYASDFKSHIETVLGIEIEEYDNQELYEYFMSLDSELGYPCYHEEHGSFYIDFDRLTEYINITDLMEYKSIVF